MNVDFQTTYLTDLTGYDYEIIAINECSYSNWTNNTSVQLAYNYSNVGSSHDIIFDYTIQINTSNKQLTITKSGSQGHNSPYTMFLQVGYPTYQVNNGYQNYYAYTNMKELSFDSLDISQSFSLLGSSNALVNEVTQKILQKGYNVNYQGGVYPIQIRTTLVNNDYLDFYNELVNNSYNEGYSSGYSSGYNAGVIDTNNSEGGIYNNGVALMGSVFEGVGGLLHYEVMPNITIGGLVSIPLIGVLIIAVFKLLK